MELSSTIIKYRLCYQKTMNKIAIPALLVATIMVAGAFAFVPVEQASTVHTSGTVLANNLTGGIQTLPGGGGAANLTDLITAATSTGADVITLADGTSGQMKIIVHAADGGSLVVTPANMLGGSNVDLPDVSDSAILVFDGTNWSIVSTEGGTVEA